MSEYTKTNWKNGDIITAEKLNKIEDGIAKSNFKINYAEGVYIPDPNAEDPTATVEGLLQILPKNLTAEDFMGAIISGSAELGPDMWIRSWLTISYVSAGNPEDPWLALHAPSFGVSQDPSQPWFVRGVALLYNRETGYLVDDNFDSGEDPAEGGGSGDNPN